MANLISVTGIKPEKIEEVRATIDDVIYERNMSRDRVRGCTQAAVGLFFIVFILRLGAYFSKDSANLVPGIFSDLLVLLAIGFGVRAIWLRLSRPGARTVVQRLKPLMGL